MTVDELRKMVAEGRALDALRLLNQLPDEERLALKRQLSGQELSDLYVAAMVANLNQNVQDEHGQEQEQ